MSRSSFVVYDYEPGNLPPEFLQALGMVTAAGAHTESIVQRFIGGLLAVDEIEFHAVTTEMSAQLMDKVARSLIALNAPSAEIIDRVDDLLDAVNRATERRNILVHSSYCRHPETGAVYRVKFKARGKLEAKPELVDIPDIRRQGAEIYRAGLDLMQFICDHELHPRNRVRPLYEEIDRKPKARKERQAARAK